MTSGMRVAFDVRNEFQQLLAHLSWEQLRGHWISVELLRGYRAVRAVPGRIRQSIDVLRMLRAVRRRVIWICPRVPAGLLRRASGLVLTCAFIVIGMKMWPRDGESARAAMPAPLQNSSSVSQAGPSGPGLQANRPGPEGPASGNPKPSPIDVLAQRKSDLVKHQH